MTFLRRLLPTRRSPAPRIFWLTDDIAVAGAPSVSDWPSIVGAGVRCVVDLRAEAPDNAPAVRAAGLEYLRLPITEHAAPSTGELAAVTDWIIDRISSAGPVLVHCREGRGRSPLVACATLVRLGIPPFEAYQALRRARPDIALSDAQAEMLRRFALETRPG